MDDLKGQARRGADSRRAILQAATEVFARKGFRGGGLAEVAERVEMTAAGILYHFGSKEALLLAVIEYRDERARALGADLWQPGQRLESLKQLVRFAEMSEAEPGLAALHTVLQIENLEPSDLAYDYFQRRTQWLQRWIGDTLMSARSLGEVAEGVDLEAKTVEIAAFLEGAAVLWLMNRHLSLVAMYRTYLDAVAAQITPLDLPDR